MLFYCTVSNVFIVGFSVNICLARNSHNSFVLSDILAEEMRVYLDL